MVVSSERMRTSVNVLCFKFLTDCDGGADGSLGKFLSGPIRSGVR